MTEPTKRPVGRPVTATEPRKPRQVMLSEASAATARRLGDGNLSEGVRKALELGESWAVEAVNRREKR